MKFCSCKFAPAVISGAVAAVFLSGCKDDAYDLGNIDTTMRFEVNDLTLPVNLDPVDFDSSWDIIKDDLSNLYQFENEGEKSRVRSIAATMTASAEYTLPVYRKVSFGLLNTTRMMARFSWTEFRIGANFEPVKWFSAGVNYGIGTFGSAFGWIVNFAPKGFNLYVGMDSTLGKLSKQYIPLNSNASLSFGINFPF